MSDIATLRALALGRTAKLRPLPLVLDDEIRANLNEAQNALGTLLSKRAELERTGNLPAKPAQPESLADEGTPAKADIDRMIEATRETVEKIQQQARDGGSLIVLQFRALAPAEFAVIRDKSEREAHQKVKDTENTFDRTFHTLLRDALLAKCYVGAFTPGPEDDLSGGDDLEISLDDLTKHVLTDGDLHPNPATGPILSHLVLINRGVSVVPFLPASSGRPAKS